jgi:hypothetical protein
MSFPLTYRDDDARPTEDQGLEPASPAVDTGTAAADSDHSTAVRHISEDLLNEMGRALADRLNALVDELDKEH